MGKIDFRHRARLHVDEAKDQLAKAGETPVRYACLELRMAIEALTYETLQTYLAEVPNSAMGHWQPKRVIDELLAVDPNADQSVKLFVGLEETPGVEAEEMDLLGEDKRFTVKWANKAHNALGSFLHEPTIAQHEKGAHQPEEAARKKAAEVIAELEAVLNATLFNVNFGIFTEFDCDCGFKIKRKVPSLESGKSVICASCGKGYHHAALPEGSHRFWPDEHSYKCGKCQSDQLVNTELLRKLPALTCEACGAVAHTELAYRLTYPE